MNTNIKQLAHEAKRPVSVEREYPDILVIEGVKFAGDVFRTLAFPGPDCLYFFRRDTRPLPQRYWRCLHETNQPSPLDDLLLLGCVLDCGRAGRVVLAASSIEEIFGFTTVEKPKVEKTGGIERWNINNCLIS